MEPELEDRVVDMLERQVKVKEGGRSIVWHAEADAEQEGGVGAASMDNDDDDDDAADDHDHDATDDDARLTTHALSVRKTFIHFEIPSSLFTNSSELAELKRSPRSA